MSAVTRFPLRRAKAMAQLAATLSLLLSHPLVALPEDSQQPIHIAADSAVKDNKQGVTIYAGNVSMQQGTLAMKGDKVTIYSQAERVVNIIAQGKPAHFQQQPDPNKGKVLAEGLHIHYAVEQQRIKLSGNASIDQDGAKITGDTIHYDIDAARVEAKGADKRVKVVIPAPQATAAP